MKQPRLPLVDQLELIKRWHLSRFAREDLSESLKIRHAKAAMEIITWQLERLYRTPPLGISESTFQAFELLAQETSEDKAVPPPKEPKEK